MIYRQSLYVDHFHKINVNRFVIVTIFAPHVDDQGQRVSDAYGSANSISCSAVSVPYFHVTFGWRQRENDRIAGGHSIIKREQ